MADLSAHRGKASALLAAGVVALGVLGGARAIVHARGEAAPAETTQPAVTRPTGPSPLSDGPSTPAPRVKVEGLAQWRPPRLPKRLRLKPVVRHRRKVITVVSSVAVAVPAAPTGSAPRAPKTWPKQAATTPEKPRAHRKRPKAVKPVKPAKQPTAKHPPATTPATAPPPAAPTTPATTPTTPPTIPVDPPAPPTTTTIPPPPTTPTTPATPTGTVTITGGNVAGRIVTATWAGADPAATTYQWQLCDPDGGTCQPIVNETAGTYTLRMSDIGMTIRVSVASGSFSATSRATDQIERGG